jgi:3-mercaptopyruvate sulfurtransferase SseA
MNTNKIGSGILEDMNIKLKVKFVTGISNLFGYCFIVTVTFCLLITPSLIAQEEIEGNLVNVRWLEENLKNPDILILDASPTKVYNEKHIPGAVSVDFMSYGIQDIPISEMEQRFQSWGISLRKKIIIYDQGGSIMATRLLFDLYYHGFPANDLLILNGGLFKWQEEGLPVTNEIISLAEKGTFQIKKFNEDARVKLPEFLTGTGDKKNYTLLEALDANWHFGELQFFDRPGHIPNGIMLPSTDFYMPDKTFKSAEEIRKMLNYLGVKSEQQIYTYCGGGISASVPFFTIKFILDFPNVKLFSESELGWLKDERELPYWTYDAPYLMRETGWLKTWGGKIMRMYGVSNVSMVDVRVSGEFSEGHLPFSINIPSDLFNSNITNPGKLAEILGQSGVNVSDEAVVISGSGLTKESALAFVILEKLGQKKISVFMDSKDKWAELGFSVIKDSASNNLKNVGNGLSTTYPVNLRKDIIIEDANTTKGLYPKIFIASGKNVPDKIQDGIVVHLPYTELLNEDGTPKAAKDIWNILNKAGVSRYAEVVCFSDDPGEAAVNYFILKLMGYPDIKVLVM